MRSVLQIRYNSDSVSIDLYLILLVLLRTENKFKLCKKSLFGYENFRNFIFWPKLSPTCTESVVRGNLFEKQGFICYRPVNMIQQN